jgi:hypothetical protein
MEYELKFDKDDTHMTIAWVLGDTHDKKLIPMILEYLQKTYNKKKMIISVQTNGDYASTFPTAVCVIGKLAKIKKQVMDFLLEKKINIELSITETTPHINIQLPTRCKEIIDKIDVLDIKNWELGDVTLCGKKIVPIVLVVK